MTAALENQSFCDAPFLSPFEHVEGLKKHEIWQEAVNSETLATLYYCVRLSCGSPRQKKKKNSRKGEMRGTVKVSNAD